MYQFKHLLNPASWSRWKTLVILGTTFYNSIHGIQLGRCWLEKYTEDIIMEIVSRGGLQTALEELKQCNLQETSQKKSSKPID